MEVYQGGSEREFVLSSLPPFPISQGSQDDVLYRFGVLENIEAKALINTMQPQRLKRFISGIGYDERGMQMIIMNHRQSTSLIAIALHVSGENRAHRQ
ncbi:hypothetical protein IGW68_12335 [Shewanella benthica]|uniref:hypothetical protein n=1 Tax=Shewanella benthica TaxID=43661 RepID=UPI0018790EB8|nr:hypothetical protein [Shewanella benthica]MBE7215948.1 hypothetical protein [Shewanella benthica]